MIAALQGFYNWINPEFPKPPADAFESESFKTLKQVAMVVKDGKGKADTLPDGLSDDHIYRVDDFVNKSLPEIPKSMTLRLHDRAWGRDLFFTAGKVYWIFDDKEDFESHGSYKTAHLALDLFSQEVVGFITSKRMEELDDALFLNELAPHPHIARCLTFGKVPHSQEVFMVMPFYRNGSLLHFLKEQGLTLGVRKRLDMAYQIACGLAHIHQHKIVHRDVKPDNILVDQEGNMAIADFGFAIHINNPKEVIRKADSGSRPYLPPEVCKTYLKDLTHDQMIRSLAKGVDFSGDIWGFGCVMWLLFSKDFSDVPWYRHENIFQAVSDLEDGWMPSGKDFICPEIQPLIKSMLEIDPKKRPTADVIEKQLHDRIQDLDRVKEPLTVLELLHQLSAEKEKQWSHTNSNPVSKTPPIPIPRRIPTKAHRHQYLAQWQERRS